MFTGKAFIVKVGYETVTLKKEGLDYSVYIQHSQQWQVILTYSELIVLHIHKKNSTQDVTFGYLHILKWAVNLFVRMYR